MSGSVLLRWKGIMRKAGVLKQRRKAGIPTSENRKGTKASIEKRCFPEMLSFGAVVQRLQRERREEEEEACGMPVLCEISLLVFALTSS